ncbi:hypothetical protein [Nostoc favosum]|uniref:hypothetical protein n=1 Tax=Nostoc favosum TaxID=2907819 RepID=UPI003F68BAA1
MPILSEEQQLLQLCSDWITSAKAIHLWCYFFFKLQQTENSGTLVAGIVIGSLVLGLHPSLLKAIAPLESPKPIK